jgi:hypothetical protein
MRLRVAKSNFNVLSVKNCCQIKSKLLLVFNIENKNLKKKHNICSEATYRLQTTGPALGHSERRANFALIHLCQVGRIDGYREFLLRQNGRLGEHHQAQAAHQQRMEGLHRFGLSAHQQNQPPAHALATPARPRASDQQPTDTPAASEDYDSLRAELDCAGLLSPLRRGAN